MCNLIFIALLLFSFEIMYPKIDINGGSSNHVYTESVFLGCRDVDKLSSLLVKGKYI
jgi:hypothetical protein